MSSKNHILKNGIAATIRKILLVGEHLFLVPFFIKFWGTSYYGEWLSLTIIPTTFALAEGGFGTAVANTFILQYSSGKLEEAANTVKTGIYSISALIVIALLILMASVKLLSSYGYFSNLVIPEPDAAKAVTILMIARLFNFYQIVFEAHFRVAKLADWGINLQNIEVATRIISGIVILHLGGDAVAYAYATLASVAILNPIYISIARSKLRLHKNYQGTVSIYAMKKLFVKGFGYLLTPVWQSVYFQGTTLVIRYTLGPQSVTLFNTVRTLVRASSQALGIIMTAVYPEFQLAVGRADVPKSQKMFSMALLANVLISLLFCVFFVLAGTHIYNYWTGNAISPPSEIWNVFILGIMFYSVWYTFSYIFEALNKPYAYTVISIILSIVSVGTTWILIKYIGELGAAVGNIVFDILMCIFLVPIASKIFNYNPFTILSTAKEMARQLTNKIRYISSK